MACTLSRYGLFRSPGTQPEEFMEAWEKYHYDFRLLVLNELSEPTSLHAHGLNPPNGQDGVAYITEPPIPPGEEREYRFRAQVGGGSFWLHAHSSLHAGLGLWIPLVLQHPSQERQNLGNPSELILMAEDQFVHPYCAYSPFLYPEKCQHLVTTEHARVAYYLNRKTSPQVVPCSAGEKFVLRLRNAGTEATWHFNLSWFSSAMLLALDGNDVQRGHMVDTKEHAIILSSAQRTDVLVQVPGSGCYPIIVSSGSHAGDEQHPVSRVLFLDASKVPEPCVPPEFPRFMPAYSHFSRLTPARYPMKKRKVMRNLSWEISAGEQFGFAGNCYAQEQVHLCREYKWPLPPTRSWQQNETGYMVHSRRPCQGCELLERFNATGIIHGRCWEWSDMDAKNCSRFRPVPLEYAIPIRQQSLQSKPLMVCRGDRVQLTVSNVPRFGDGEGHPIHLHGHIMELRKVENFTGGRWVLEWQGDASGPHDTVWVERNHRVTMEFDANNPGRWLLHCHNEFHLFNGMSTRVVYHPDSSPECPHLSPQWAGET
ncbi:LAC19 [Symbiodinium sp. CCMP2456]|nr:LAC19 [Symbiodinium sp. CCMP2456]